MKQFRLLTLLALLLTAATGAWATDVYLVGNGTGNWLNGVAWDPGASGNKMTEQNGVYSITFNDVDANSELLFKFAINGSWDVNYGCTSWDANELNKTLSNIEAGGANFKFGLTEKADVTISFNLSEMTYMISTKGMKVGDDAATGYTVSLKDGVKDADKWTVKVGDGQAQALPIGGLKGDGSETVTLQYTGRLKVKGVKATSEAAPAAKPAASLTLGSMPNGGDPFSGSSGSGAYSQTFAVGGQIAIIYKNTSNESVKVVTDALTAADISNEGKTATINVSIDDADKTQGVTYIYPAAMANDDGTINCDFKNQDGTVTAIYSGSGAWDGDALSSATMESQQDIVKFTLQDNGGNAISASSLTVSAASNKLVKTKGFVINPTLHTGGYNYDGGTDGYAAPSGLVDGNKTSTKWCAGGEHKSDGVWYCEFHTASAVQVNGYTITTGDDNSSWNNRNPKDWVLKAKVNSGDAWTTIATVTNDATLDDINNKSYDFFVDVPGEYQYFRFEVSATRGADVMQLEELELFKCDYGTAYGNITVTPDAAASELTVALRNENDGADTYTVSANAGGKKYAFSKSGVTFQNGKYYEITVKMTEQAASTVTWNFSEMSEEHADLEGDYTYKDVTLSGNGALDFENGMLEVYGGLTFTNTLGKNFKSIVITTPNPNIIGSGWTNDYGNGTSTWTGNASKVTIGTGSNAYEVTSIVFTLE